MDYRNMTDIEFRRRLCQKILDELSNTSACQALPDLPDNERRALRDILVDICAIMETGK